MYNPLDIPNYRSGVIPRILHDSTYATHRYFSDYFGSYLYFIANGVIELSIAFCVDIKRIEVKNTNRWDNVS